MKNTITVAVIGLALGLGGACKRDKAERDTEGDKTPKVIPGATESGSDAKSAAPGTPEAGAPGSMGAGEPAPAASNMSDGEIAAFLANANQGEVDLGKLAAKTTKNKDVKHLADMMVKDHTAADKKAKDALAKAKIAPEEGEQARALAETAKTTMDKLKTLEGAEFDRAYVDSQVAMHQQVLDAVDQMLLPNADSADLKQLMTEVRPSLAMHLEHSKKAQASLTAK